MADFSSVYSVGESLAQYFRNIYPAELRADHPCRFELAGSADFAQAQPFDETTVSIYLYRILPDQYLHPAGSSLREGEEPRAMPLDLHFMVSVWADNTHTEQLLMTWVMAQLHWNPVLDRSTLMETGGWDSSETVQISPSNISQEDLSRLWDVFEPKYRLSSTYVARVIHVDPPPAPVRPPVVSRRMAPGTLTETGR
ncbi:DUF4255 domain-containing protein [Mangrovicoccus sp. HB161399]|uniref:DUF4255 domain-containing protein n=1 Tax=Mangrovicoccus sp. HB161399 TaxID=2720392 RepID=UPI001551F498|nr:DUF4255 domain-containing protein [Mangrovicoccus sp. HB161399]